MDEILSSIAKLTYSAATNGPMEDISKDFLVVSLDGKQQEWTWVHIYLIVSGRMQNSTWRALSTLAMNLIGFQSRACTL